MRSMLPFRILSTTGTLMRSIGTLIASNGSLMAMLCEHWRSHRPGTKPLSSSCIHKHLPASSSPSGLPDCPLTLLEQSLGQVVRSTGTAPISSNTATTMLPSAKSPFNATLLQLGPMFKVMSLTSSHPQKLPTTLLKSPTTPLCCPLLKVPARI